MKSEIRKTALDFHIVDKVKKLRQDNHMSHAELGFKLGVTAAFIGQIENPNSRAKYNIAHLNKLGKIFKCSPKFFLPDEPLEL